MSVAVAVVVVIGVLLGTRTASVADVSRLVDTVLKALAIIVGGIWALNRYFIARTDAVQLRVDSEVRTVPAEAFGDSATHGLLLYRIDVVNTGRVLVKGFQQALRIDAIFPDANGVSYEQIEQWPETGYHPGGLIEPGSWAAINAAVPIAPTVRAARFYLELHLQDGTEVNWHKTFKLDGGFGGAQSFLP